MGFIAYNKFASFFQLFFNFEGKHKVMVKRMEEDKEEVKGGGEEMKENEGKKRWKKRKRAGWGRSK